jgi:hypothetical protein
MIEYEITNNSGNSGKERRNTYLPITFQANKVQENS